MSPFVRPPSLNDYTIAVICALPKESNAVEALIDEDWEEKQKYRKNKEDENSYTMCRIGVHNVVLAFMSTMGKKSSASLATHLRHSFPRIKLSLVVGICGGTPTIRKDPRGPRNIEVLLGDIIISTAVVQYDLGHQYSNELRTIDTLHHNLPRPNPEILSFQHKMKSLRSHKRLEDNTLSILLDLLGKEGFESSGYQGVDQDIFYDSNYRHKHHGVTDCICARCIPKTTRSATLRLN